MKLPSPSACTLQFSGVFPKICKYFSGILSQINRDIIWPEQGQKQQQQDWKADMDLPAENSPFATLNPASLSGLKLRHHYGQKLGPEDLVPVIEANSELAPNQEFGELMLAILRNETGPGRGRHSLAINDKVRLVCADMYIEERSQEIAAERRSRPSGAKRIQGELEPGVIAAEEISGRLGYGNPRSLINAISKLNWDE